MTPAEAIKRRGGLVRIAPQATNTNSRHWGRGRLIDVGRRSAVVQPLGAKTTIDVSFEHLRVWHARDPESATEQHSQEEVEMITPKSIPSADSSITPSVAAMPSPAVVPSPPPLKTLSGVLESLTSLLVQVKAAETKQKDAEATWADAERAARAAEEAVLASMENLEGLKTKVRTVRSELNTVLDSEQVAGGAA